MTGKIPLRNFMVLFILLVLITAVISVLSLTGAAVGNVFESTVANFNTVEQDALNLDLGGDVSASTTDVLQNQPEGRVILRDASLSLTVEDVTAKIADITGMVSEMGGWVVSSNTSKSRGTGDTELIYGNITVRVPSERLDEALVRIKTGVGTVNSENINGRDVTQQYVDLSSRLTNLEAAETQLQTIMDNAASVDEVLSVYNELVRVRGDIESIKGQLQYFDEAAAFSSIVVNLSPILPDVITSQTTGWSPARTVENALGALIRVGQFLADVIIVVVIVVLPPVLILSLPLWLLFRRYRRSISATTT